MKIAVIGTGYVGLPSGVGFAELGHTVYCIDNNLQKIDALQRGKLTLYENGLAEMFERNKQAGRLIFTTQMAVGVKNADLVIIAVGTPPHPVTKEADLQYIEAAASELAPHLTGYTVVATKSTVPVGTGDKIEDIIRNINPQADVDVISLPEFLREGFALQDFFAPERIVVGTDSLKAQKLIDELYSSFHDTKILHVNRRSSEAIKYASNAFLAIKLNYINELADFCEKTGANINEVAEGMGADSRIGNKFLKAGPGYGGSCFPKDTCALSFMARKYGLNMPLVDTTIAENEKRHFRMAERILNYCHNKNANIAVLGLAFKNGTDDCRTSPAIKIIEYLLAQKANICAFDPRAMASARTILGDRIKYADDAYTAAKDVDVTVILTEWTEFKTLNWLQMAASMRNKIVLDLRNILDKQYIINSGIEYHCIGCAD